MGSNKCLQNSFQGAIVTGPTSQPPPLQDPKSPGKDARYNEYMRRFNKLAQAPGWQPFGWVSACPHGHNAAGGGCSSQTWIVVEGAGLSHCDRNRSLLPPHVPASLSKPRAPLVPAKPRSYIYTKYGNRPLDAVLEDIATW